jgi:hypothetical protein
MRQVGPVAVPMLMLQGDMDPLTSIEDARFAARTLPESRLVVVAGGTHDLLGSECVRTIREQFFEAPGSAPDTSCLEDKPDRRFATRVWKTPAARVLARRLQNPAGAWPLMPTLFMVAPLLRWPLWMAARRVATKPVRRAKIRLGAVASAQLALLTAYAAVVVHTASTNWPMLLVGLPTSARIPLVLAGSMAAGLTVWAARLTMLEWQDLTAGTRIDSLLVLGGATAVSGWLAAIHFS